ncbi:hypothetical protein ACHAXH_003793 [Discostella pseudostelligera]
MTTASTNSNSNNPTLTEPFHNDQFESLPHVPCVSLFHRSGRVGCGTYGHQVMNGRLLHWTSVVSVSYTDDNDQDEASSSNNKGTMPPYVAVMDEVSYTSTNIAKLIKYASQYTARNEYGSTTTTPVEEAEVVPGSDRAMRGVLVLKSSSSSATDSAENNGVSDLTSPEPSTPQGQYTPSGQLTVGNAYPWNVHSNDNDGEEKEGLINLDMYGIPTAYIYDVSTVNYLRSVAMEQSESLVAQDQTQAASAGAGAGEAYPSIIAEFNYYMGPGGLVDDNGNNVYTSKTCLGWKDTNGEWSPQCAPLGGNSIWATAGSPVALEYGAGNNNNAKKPTILISTSIDSTSMFHDLSPGASNAASNILTLLMASHLLGSTVSDATLDTLYGKIAFAFFQGESYGYLGSRRFVKDVVDGFTCDGGEEGVSSVFKTKSPTAIPRACLHPLRSDLTFQNLGTIHGMIAVDQVGALGGSKNMYVHGGETTDGGAGMAAFLSNVVVELSSSDNNGGDGYTAQASSVGQQDDGTVPLPPTPLSSLVKISGSSIGGIVLSGYDDAFVANSVYHSHLDSTTTSSSKLVSIDKEAIASAATLLARAAVAAAYQDEDNGVDYETAAAYAVKLLPNAVDSTSDIFTKLYNCLFEDGNCETFLSYGEVERENDALRTGVDLGMGVPLGTPPNYYVSIYESSNGQAFVRASGKYYGSLSPGEAGEDGEVVKNYGEDETDAFLVRPTLLEMSVFGLLNDFLGRGSFVASSASGDDESATTPSLTKCKVSSDCSSVSYCSTSNSAAVTPTCAGGSCVCGSRSHYHPALDEALSPATNARPGRFVVNDNDEGVSALYAEPYWSHYVGVRIYNDAGTTPGVYAAVIGSLLALMCMAIVVNMKKKLVKEKVY